MSKPSPGVTTEVLQTSADAWSRHDVDALMAVQGERGVSEWTFTGTAKDGTRVETTILQRSGVGTGAGNADATNNLPT